MTSRDPISEEGPELLPPAELLRLRAELARPPAAEIRSQHVAATAMAARQRGNRPMGRFASRGARAAIAIVASLAITSSLAGAQLLPDQAQRLLSNVSDRFAPSHGDTDPPADPAQPGDATVLRTPDGGGPTRDASAVDEVTTTTITGATAAPDGATTTTVPSTTSTTIPGPGGPGSSEDPTDPTTTTTTQPPTTTTTVPPTTTTVPPTTTTTVPPTTTTTAVPVTPDDPPPSDNPPAGARR
jgi:hypothetical protein